MRCSFQSDSPHEQARGVWLEMGRVAFNRIHHTSKLVGVWLEGGGRCSFQSGSPHEQARGGLVGNGVRCRFQSGSPHEKARGGLSRPRDKQRRVRWVCVDSPAYSAGRKHELSRLVYLFNARQVGSARNACGPPALGWGNAMATRSACFPATKASDMLLLPECGRSCECGQFDDHLGALLQGAVARRNASLRVAADPESKHGNLSPAQLALRPTAFRRGDSGYGRSSRASAGNTRPPSDPAERR